MPYALVALACAVRGARTEKWRWDVAAALSTLAALGCKNTFVALIPAQLVLRLLTRAGDDREAARSRYRAALLLLSPLLLPVLHFVDFVARWHPGQYVLSWPSLQQLGSLRYALQQAVGLDYIGVALVLALYAIGRPRWVDHRVTAAAGLALLVAGGAVYLPIGGIEPRYSMPAVWGVDLWIALLLSALLAADRTVWRRAALVTLAIGLLAMAVVNIARQNRAAARSALLWQALEHVERHVPSGATVGWLDGPRLGIGEGIHFFWHIERRDRRRVQPLLLDATGQPRVRLELHATDGQPSVVVTGTPDPPPFGAWDGPTVFTSPYWFGSRRDECFLWTGS